MYFDLSLAQEEIYKRECYYPGTSINNISADLVFCKDISYEDICVCINNVIRKSSTLRLQICINGDTAQQYVSEFKELNFPFVQVNSFKEYKEWMQSELHECIFDYNKSLINCSIVRIKDEGKWSIFINIHHLISDALGISCMIEHIVNEIENKLGNETVDYDDYDYSQWQKREKRYLCSKTYDNDKKYWQSLVENYEVEKVHPQNDGNNIEAAHTEYILTREI